LIKDILPNLKLYLNSGFICVLKNGKASTLPFFFASFFAVRQPSLLRLKNIILQISISAIPFFLIFGLSKKHKKDHQFYFKKIFCKFKS